MTHVRRTLYLAVLSAAGVVAGLSACSDAPTPVSPEPTTAAAISDAVHSNGNEAFYFLPPMVPKPAFSGTFDPSVEPSVEICRLVAGACSGVPLVTYTATGGPGGEKVRLDAEGAKFAVNWHTNEFNLDTGAIYRIRVLVSGIELGFADVQPVSSGRELKNVNTNEFIALKDGRTLPIKFRVEEGALVPAGGLLAYYPFDGDFTEATGTFADATPVAGVGFGLDRLGSSAVGLSLDGIDSEVRLPAEITNSRAAGTINLWVEVVNPTTRERCGRTDHPNSTPYHCQYNVFSKEGSTLRAQFSGAAVGSQLDRIYFRVTGDSFMYTQPGAVSPTTWTMYTFTWDGSGKRIYINGQLAASEAGTFVTASSGALNLGSNGSGTLRFRERLYGSIDEVRIYDRALDAVEVGLLCDVQSVCGS